MEYTWATEVLPVTLPMVPVADYDLLLKKIEDKTGTRIWLLFAWIRFYLL